MRLIVPMTVVDMGLVISMATFVLVTKDGLLPIVVIVSTSIEFINPLN